MFKIEMHLHSLYCSACSNLSAEEIVEGYLAAGYSGLVLTDHYNRDTFRMLKLDPAENHNHLDAFLTGYRHLYKLGNARGLKIYRGAEVRFDGSENDYLLYGFRDELLQDPQRVFTMGVEQFYKLAKEGGALLIHAHPYRNGGRPSTPKALDGVEVINTHHKHNNRNDLALTFAREYHLLEIAGSDCHEPPHIGKGGILAEYLPENEQELVALIRSGKYQLIGK